MANICPKCKTENPENSKFCRECAAPLTQIDGDEFTETLEIPSEDLSTGSTYAGRYQVIEELGKGGMGRVFKVHDTEINEKIALKLIKPEIASDKNTIERFRNELKAARGISHKNVCRMFDLNKEKGHYFITMEYVPGEDLKSMIQMTRQLTVGTVISIAKQICEGLSEAHRQGTVHRDLKPSNIMIDKGGHVRILDFGIARTVKGKAITGSGVMIGTPEYMSPEQVEGKDIDLRADIYSLGILLYEMLTGSVPFTGDSPFTVGIKHKSEIPESPLKINPRISEDLNGLILKCLEKDKEKRFQNAGELLLALERIEQGLPAAEGAVPRPKPVTSREITVSFNVKKYLIPVFLVIAATTIALFIWSPWTKKAAAPTLSDKTSLAVLYFKNNTGDDLLDFWRTALSDSIITDLSQSKYFDVLTSDKVYSILKKLNLLEAENYATEDLRDVAAEGRINHVLTGNLSRAGSTFRIEYSIIEIPSGKSRGSSRVEGKGEESLFSLVDQITKEIKQEFNLSREQIAGDLDREIGTITTGSIEAAKYYSLGWQAYLIGEYEKSIAHLERAITIDPEFAMAYRSLAMAYSNIMLHAKRDEFLIKAFELSDRLPDRERYLIEGDFYSHSQTTYDQAIAAFDKLLELYPDDRTGNNNSAILFNGLEEWEKAIERFKTAIQAGDPSIQGYYGLANAYRYMGRYEDARDILLDYIENFQDNKIIRLALADTYVVQREFHLALEEIDRAYSLDPTDPACVWTRGDIFICKGELEAAKIPYKRLAEREIPVDKVIGILGLLLVDCLQGLFSSTTAYSQQAIDICRSFDQKDWEVNFRLKLGDVYLYRGKLKEALSEYDQAEQIAVERGDLTKQWLLEAAKGIYFLKNRDRQAAQETAQKLKQSIESGLNEKAIREYDYLMGRIEYEKENYSSALEHLQKARSVLPAENDAWDAQAKFSFTLGQTYHKTGELLKAQATFEEILPMTYGRIYYPILYILAFYELGRVFQDQGNTTKAIEYYEKFLDLWKSADPGIAEVEDVKKRLSEIKK